MATHWNHSSPQSNRDAAAVYDPDVYDPGVYEDEVSWDHDALASSRDGAGSFTHDAIASSRD